MLGCKDGLRPAVSPPMRTNGEGSIPIAGVMSASPRVVPSAHHPILPGITWGQTRVAPAGMTGDESSALKCLDAP
jgi:hypothetical protein